METTINLWKVLVKLTFVTGRGTQPKREKGRPPARGPSPLALRRRLCRRLLASDDDFPALDYTGALTFSSSISC